MKACLIFVFLLAGNLAGLCQSADTNSKPKPAPERKWFEAISIRGYAQLRYNRLLETNPGLKCE